MRNWFETKVTYEKTLENGMEKKVTEAFVFDAQSWTEVEARIIEELKPYISGEFVIADIKRAKLSEIFFSDEGDRFFKAKVQFISLDQTSGAEKRISAYMLAQASDINHAQEVIKKKMADTLGDYEIVEVKGTKIMDVFPNNDNKDETTDN